MQNHAATMGGAAALFHQNACLKMYLSKETEDEKTLPIARRCATNEGMAKTHAISIRFDPELRAELEKIAQRENRKLSNLVETVLRQYVEAQKRKAKRDE